MGGALALLGMLFWAAFIAEYGALFWIPATICTLLSIVVFIAYVVKVDGRESDSDNTFQRTMRSKAIDARVPFVWQPYDANQFSHGHAHGHMPWPRRLWLGFRRWLGFRN